MLTDDQATRLICGVLSALNATKMGGPMMATQERVAEAIKHLPHTQVQQVLLEVSNHTVATIFDKPEIIRPHG